MHRLVSTSCSYFIPEIPAEISTFLRTLVRDEESVPGGRLCFSLSALSASLSTSVYRYRLHLTLNLIWFDLRDFLMRAAVSSVSFDFSRVTSLSPPANK